MTCHVASLCRRRPPEELELDVVWITESEHRVVRVGQPLYSGVRDAELVEPSRPLVQIVAAFDEELKVIQSGSKLAERLAGVVGVTDEAEHKSAAWITEADIGEAPVGRYRFVAHFEAEHLGVPSSTPGGIQNREVHFDATVERGHAASLPPPIEAYGPSLRVRTTLWKVVMRVLHRTRPPICDVVTARRRRRPSAVS
jgi:hypothetical protein